MNLKLGIRANQLWNKVPNHITVPSSLYVWPSKDCPCNIGRPYISNLELRIN